MSALAVHRVGASLALLATAIVQLVPANAGASICLGGMKSAMTKGHFSGPRICSRKANLTLVGKTTGPTPYYIYDYRYSYMPPGGNVLHGGQRLLVFRGGKYLGQYSMNPPPYTVVRVTGAYATLSKHGAETVVTDFSKGPPEASISSCPRNR